MVRLTRLAAVLAVTPLFACAYALSPVTSSIYGKVQGPIAVTNLTAEPTKIGRSCASSILGLVANGDASIEAAKRAGGITTVASVDFESTNVLFIYATFCTVVRGS